MRHARLRPGGSGWSVRPGLTMLESALGLGMLAVGMVLLTQVSIWCLSERQSLAARQHALQAASNVLELARATSWDLLTPEWASGQQLPESLGQRLHEGKLRVRVEQEPNRPQVKRVTVELAWQLDKNHPAPPIKLAALFTARALPGTGGKQ